MENKTKKKHRQPHRKHKEKKTSQDEFQWKRAGKTSLIWISIILVAVYLSSLLTNGRKNELEIEYTQYREKLLAGDIGKAVIIGKTFHGEFITPQVIDTKLGSVEDITKFRLTLPFVDREVTEQWDQAGLDYSFKEKSVDWTGYLLNMFPWILLIGFWIFMLRRMQGGAGGMKGIFNFGKSRASLWTSDQPRVTFRDVASCEEAKEELEEAVSYTHLTLPTKA